MREGSHPSTLAAPVTRAGASTITPPAVHTPPKPSSQPVPTVVSHAHETFLAASSQHNNQHSAPNATMPAPIQPRAVTGFSGFIVSFIVWMGGAVAAVRAGMAEPMTVTTTPTMKPTATAVGEGVGEPDSGKPPLLRPQSMSSMSPQPRSTPSTEPMTPRMSA